MPSYIIHHNGAFNMFTTIADGVCFVEAVTFESLARWYQEEYGRQGMDTFDDRIERAKKNGCSGFFENLDSIVRQYNVGQKKNLTRDQFIAEFLTLRDSEAGGSCDKAKD